jgi:hypothetical protein
MIQPSWYVVCSPSILSDPDDEIFGCKFTDLFRMRKLCGYFRCLPSDSLCSLNQSVYLRPPGVIIANCRGSLERFAPRSTSSRSSPRWAFLTSRLPSSSLFRGLLSPRAIRQGLWPAAWGIWTWSWLCTVRPSSAGVLWTTRWPRLSTRTRAPPVSATRPTSDRSSWSAQQRSTSTSSVTSKTKCHSSQCSSCSWIDL